MRARKAVLAALILFGGAVATSSNARGDESDVRKAEFRAAIEKLLEVGWKTTPQARLATNAQYIEVLKVAGTDLRANRAAALVLMQQRRFEDVPRQVDAILDKQPDDLLAWRAKVWVAAMLKNYPQALLAADDMSQHLPAEAEPSTASETEAREYIAFLGRIFGYLGGPMTESANQEQRKSAEKKIVARLSESRRAAFEAARDGVLQRYLEMTDEKIEQKEKAKEAADAEKEKTLQEIAALRDENAKRLAELKDQRDKLRSELKAELDEIAKADQPLVSELARLTARAATINRDLFTYDNEIARLQAAAAREEDQNLRNLLSNQITSLQFQAARVQGDLAAVNRLGAGVNAQRAQLVARGQQAQANFGGQLGRLDKEYQELQKGEKRADVEEKRARRPGSTTTGRSLSLGATATALSTYDQFPLEEAKARLLDELKEEK